MSRTGTAYGGLELPLNPVTDDLWVPESMNQSRTRHHTLIERNVLRDTHDEGGNKNAPNQQNEILTAPDMDGSKKMVRRNYSSHQLIKTKQMSSERSEQGKSRTDESVRDLTVERNQR